ncbi:MAG: UDP-N-acetylmuramoyl-tripeptide--D-alanyl-D-alanine ligase [Candidatus Magasanikbacteria bacterium]|nr:UDP-N-acetylmuramoyl-tripeptide--D-alanyl-D-alanine ligase [Candidatus Magasanikbacteria bacterium]
MKDKLKNKLETILRILAIKIFNKYQPEVVAITGSVGKTSTKEAIYTVLKTSFNVRKNIKNYNNEIGIPLTIIGVESGGRSALKWFGVFWRAAKLIIFKDKNYPKILVLEMGADHPGDIKYLTDFVPVKVGVVTRVASVHLEFFGSLENVAKEKGILVQTLSRDGYAVLNADDRLVAQMAKTTKAKVLTFGLLPHAQVLAKEIAVSQEVDIKKDIAQIKGVSFKISYQGITMPVLLPKVIGQHLVYTALAAISVGLIYQINLHTIIESLKDFESPKGRMRLIKGIKNTLIIDDTYNSSPLSARKALYELGHLNIGNNNKFAVLGDMLELGKYTEAGHREVGEAVFDYHLDYLITVGEMSRDIVRGAVEAGMDQDHCFNFKDSIEAGRFVQQRIKEGDVILIKGSQGMRMEHAVKEIMAEPQRAKELLVRQGEDWK